MRFKSLGRRESWKKHSSSTTPTSSLAARSSATLSFPRMVMVPLSRRIRFKMHLMVVVLPAPFSPMRPMMVPPGMVRFTWSRAKSP